MNISNEKIREAERNHKTETRIKELTRQVGHSLNMINEKNETIKEYRAYVEALKDRIKELEKGS